MMLASNAILVAVMEVDSGLAERLRSKYGAARAYTDVAALRAESDKAYDPGQARMDIAARELELEDGNLYSREIESFSDSILGGKSVEVPLEDALQVQAVIEAAYKSVRSGKSILYIKIEKT